MKDERLIVLVDAYLDSALAAEEKKELEQVLLESDSARREFWQRASLHGWTYAATKVVYSVAPAVKERRDIRNAFDWWAVMTWFLNWKRFAAFAVAAVIVTGALIFFNQSAGDDTWDEFADDSPVLERTNTVAMLTHGAGVVWAQGSGTDLEIGALLEPGVLRLKSGVAQIQFHNGVRVILEGPAEFDIISQQETRLQYGKLTARVPPPAAGFKVDLKDMVVTDLGTEFGVNQPLAQPPQVHVFEGKVELSLPGVERPAEVLVQGQGAVIETNQINPLSVNRSLFLTENEVARRESAELESRYAAWRHTNTGLDRDPAMLVHFNFENGRSGGHSLANRSRQARKGTTGRIVDANWAEGRWPAKKSLEFKDPNDRVRLTVPDRYRSLTYMAWIRVDSLPNQNNALALTERRKPGEVHWQINRQGRLILSVRQVSTNGWEGVGSSKPVVTSDWFGRWMHVAAVYDGPGKVMSVYANGELVGTRKISKPMELELGGVELGNWARRAISPGTTRDFDGRMDEFTLLSRPLSAVEIRRQYELGKPFETMMVAALPASAPAGTRR